MITRRSQTSRLDEPSALLPTDPPARVARFTGWLLLAVFAAVAAFASLMKLPETVQAPFVLVPEDGSDPIQAPLAAEVAAVRVREGQAVKAGDELFSLRSDEIRNRQTRLRQLQEDQHALEDRIKKLDEAHTAELSIKDAEIAQAEREVVFRQKHSDTSNDFLQRAQALAKDGLISQVELLNHELAAAASEKDLVLGEKGKQQLELQRQGLVTARARQRTEETAEAEKTKMQIALLKQQLENCVGDVKAVRAPYDAVVLSVNQRNAGNVVAAGTELCQLARAGARPRVRLILTETGVPRLKPGQQVRLRFEAFPYQRYGSAPARLEWISPAAVSGLNGSGFLAAASMESEGKNPKLKPQVGMRGEARILVGRRSLMEKIFEPLRMLRENVAVK
jgi:membrane fusion protein